MVGTFLMIMNYVLSVRRGYPTEPWPGWRVLVASFR